MSLETGTTFGRYRLIREIGRGGEATVHLAEDSMLRRTVALKVFPPSIGAGPTAPPAGFLNEVEVLSRLEHPGICSIHDAGIEGGCAFIAMSYVEGRPLAEVAIAAADGVRIIADVAGTLSAAHAVGIVHGDLTPANIRVTPEGRPVLLDFGVARFLDASLQRPGGSRVAGTLPYLAPERLGNVPDVQADVFGLGAVLFELVAGRTPFSAPTRAALIAQIRRDQPPLLRSLVPGLSRDLEAVLARALDRDPMRRYPTMEAFAADLRRLRDGQRVSARRYGPIGRMIRWARRRPATAALVAFAATFLAIAVPVTASKNRDLGRRLERAGIEARRAANAARAAQDSLLRYERLADRRRLQDLVGRAARLIPPTPALVPALRRWLDDAAILTERLNEHRRALADLRRRGRPASAPPPPSADVTSYLLRDVAALRARLGDPRVPPQTERVLRGLIDRIEASLPRPPVRPEYSDQDDLGHDETLSTLADDLSRFADPDRFQGTIADVAHRIEETRLIEENAAKNARAWEAALTSIADAAACPRYRGFRLAPQVGVAPLRRDPSSGLWEFVHVLSGDSPSVSDDGGLKIGPESGIILVLVPDGISRMGARRPATGEPPDLPHVDPLAIPVESPLDDVPLDPFFIAKFEMTEAQWVRLSGTLPGGRAGEAGRPETRHGGMLPVSLVDWNEASATLARYGLELPTEAQWEYAARAETMTPWWTGAAQESLIPAAVFLTDAASPVGGRKPNAFGLHDVAGNIAEWCRDAFAWYDAARVAGTGERLGLDETGMRVRRGGSHRDAPNRLRSAGREIQDPSARHPETGIRPARRLDP